MGVIFMSSDCSNSLVYVKNLYQSTTPSCGKQHCECQLGLEEGIYRPRKTVKGDRNAKPEYFLIK